MNSRDQLGDRMKEYEQVEAGRRLLPLLPVCARIDGKTFHTFCRGLNRPYDQGFCDLMRQTAKYLVKETQANMGYCQSDEISLVWYSNDYKSKIFFDGKVQKMNSILASMATGFFNTYKSEYIPSKRFLMAAFDCRVWQVPTLGEAANMFVWREKDATRNSVEMAAQTYYSHKVLHKKSNSEMQEMLHEKGVNWNDYPAFFKRGTYIQKRKTTRKFTTEELEVLPERHDARKNPDLMIERTDIVMLDMPPITKISNRVDVILFGAEPILNGDEVHGKK